MELALAYMRRKRWEARLLSLQIVATLAEAMQKQPNGQLSLGALGMMGFRIEGDGSTSL